MRELTDSEKRILDDHEKWLRRDDSGVRADLYGADLYGADLYGANLRSADLRSANLRGADLDYSCWPLWCGSLDAIIDKRIFAQLAYHLCRTVCDDPEVLEAQRSLRHIANQFHRVDECGRIGDGEDA